MVLQRRVFVCASELALDESLSHQHMGAVYHRGRSPSAITKENCYEDTVVLKQVIERGEEATISPVIYRSQRKGCRCKATDSRAMGLAAPWYRRGGTSVESSIPYSHGGRALVIKGDDEKFNGSGKVNHSSLLNERSANTSSASEV
ncbi:hypothetical protein GW17_00060880 [Ensete ventricosum]|nr:hypothetical protein GW17_00060880 [Ensete ventricosum]RZS09756.1 hypothetical protein BHM03_00040858 [Ensete ventricosum]